MNSPLPASSALVEPRQVLGTYGHVGIEDDENVPTSLREPTPNGVALALSGLFEEARFALGMPGDRRLDLLERPVARPAFDEDQLGFGAELRHASKNLLDVPRLVSCSDDDRDRGLRRCGRHDGPSDHEIGEREVLDPPQLDEEPVRQRVEERYAQWEQNFGPMTQHFEAGDAEEVRTVFDGKPILLQHGPRPAEPGGESERRLPQSAVRIQNDSRARRAYAMYAPQHELQIPHVVNQIRQDDEVEAFSGGEFMRVGVNEAELWMRTPGSFDHGIGEIHADTDARPQARQQISGARTHFEDATVLRH